MVNSKETRYAIVRLSEHFCEAQQICNEGDPVCSCEKNEPCRYGDTKRQLVRKVKQALEIATNNGYVVENIKGRWITFPVRKDLKELDQFIVDFLGVK